MNNKYLSRKQKIQRLKDLQAGKVTVSDFWPVRTQIWEEETPGKFINQTTGEEISAIKLEERISRSDKNGVFIIW